MPGLRQHLPAGPPSLGLRLEKQEMVDGPFLVALGRPGACVESNAEVGRGQ